MTPYSVRRRSGRRAVGFTAVVVFHAAAIYVLASGLGRQSVEFLRAPLEATVLAELKPPEPPKVELPPPPPKVAPKPPPPAYVPPPKIRVAAPPPPAAITAVTQEAPKEPPAPIAPPEPVREPVKSAPVLDQGRRCPSPQYPAAARRAGETGAVILRFLIETDGSVLESQVESTSGFERLDEAARAALAVCRFRPGTVDGRPERSWARIRYVWKLQ